MTPSAQIPATHDSAAAASTERLPILDGWRALSILLVLAAHLLPLNAVLEGSNEAAAVAGMAIFFTLSGFLITKFLLERPAPGVFLVRRLARIVPLAWLGMAVAFSMETTPAVGNVIPNLLFYANLPPPHLFTAGEHLWSLCVEAQFYLGVALIVMAAGRRGLLILPLIAIAVTTLRIVDAQPVSIVTWHRIDEILAGATVALIHAGELGKSAKRWLSGLNLYLVVAVAVACCFFGTTPLAYARPYAIAAMVGVTLWYAPPWLAAVFQSRAAAYVATISYALYVVHGILTHTWLGSGEQLEKYLKRPLLIGATFALAHLSTFYFERYFMRLARRIDPKPAAEPLT